MSGIGLGAKMALVTAEEMAPKRDELMEVAMVQKLDLATGAALGRKSP